MAKLINWNPNVAPTGEALVILNAILQGIDFDALPNTASGADLSKRIFTDNFMPYAKAHWTYGSGVGLCNCEDLAEAFQLTWLRVKQICDHEGVRSLLATKEDLSMVIMQKMPVFNIAADSNGNIKTEHGELTGKCYFPVHWFCKIGSVLFDPTYSRWTTDKNDKVDRHVKKGCPRLLMSQEGPCVYIRDSEAAPGFVDSWIELPVGDALDTPLWNKKLNKAELNWIKYFLKKKGIFGSLQKPYQVDLLKWQSNQPGKDAWCKLSH